MELKTYDTILTEICDSFDSLVSPRVLGRTNTNVIYLLFKAIAKGLEVINNVCVTLDNKFNPVSCSADDLDSVASIVGTERLSGSKSALRITVKNTNDYAVTLNGKGTESGDYSYTFSPDSDTTFNIYLMNEQATVVTKSLTIQAGMSAILIGMSNENGVFHVTSQDNITVEPIDETITIPSGLTFSCEDNASVVGTAVETDADFRKRIITDTSRQNFVTELQTALKNFEGIFDARVIFNSTLESVSIGSGRYTLPPYTMAIFTSGVTSDETADLVADYIMCPTLSGDNVTTQYSRNSAFVNGKFPVHFLTFTSVPLSVEIKIMVDTKYTTVTETENEITDSLKMKYTNTKHIDVLSIGDIYSVINGLDLHGVTFLNATLKENDIEKNYRQFEVDELPWIQSVTYSIVE